MNTVLSLIIFIRLNTLKKDNNYIIADYILKNIDTIASKNINQFAKDCYVSTTTILNFCKLLGFDTFSEFKNTLLLTLKTRKLQLLEKNRNLKTKELLRQIQSFSNEKMNIEEFEEKLQSVITQIKKYKSIYLYGATFPIALSVSFIEDMALKGIYVGTSVNNYGTNTIEETTGVHIIITLSGRYIEANRKEFMQIMNMDYPTVLITRKKDITLNADYLIHLPKTISSQYDEIILLLLFDYILLEI